RSMRRSTRCSRIGRRQPRILAGPPEHALSSAASPTRWVLSEREFRRRTGSLQPLSVLWQPMPRKDTTMKLLHSVAIALTTWAGAAFAQVPAGYPGDYAKVVEAARKEGRVVVYSVLGNKAAAPLVAGFNALYPDIDVEYEGDSRSNEVTERFLDEVKHRQPSADARLHARAVARDVHQQAREASERREAVDRLRPVPARPEDHRRCDRA